MKTYAFDIETYPNFFSCVFEDCFSDERHIFYAHEKDNNLIHYLSFINNNNYLVGYNNLSFDSMLNRFILINMHKHRDLLKLLSEINRFADKLINSQRNKTYWEDNEIIYVKQYGLGYKDIDMLKIFAFDKAKKSLKMTAVNLRWHKLQELPIKPGTELTPDQYQTIIDYNINDVGITKKLFLDNIDEVKLRFNIQKEYGVNVLNSSRSNIADRLLEHFYARKTGAYYSDFRNLRTERNSIKINDCLSTRIKFQTDHFNSFLDSIRNKVIKDTKNELELSVIYELVKYNIGTGGLHSEDPPDVFNSTEDMEIIDADVKIAS